VAVAVGVGATAAQAGGSDHHARPAARTYTVHPGDTLWFIAVRVAGPDADPRPVVDAIASANHVTGTIVPGQTLQIPAA
jgi:nucleoid-associated protein YgaU